MKKVITYFIVTTLSIVSGGIAGYYSNTHLSRDKIRIEYMDLVGRNEDPSINLKDFLVLEHCLSVNGPGWNSFASFSNPVQRTRNKWEHLEGYLRNSKIGWEYFIETIDKLNADGLHDMTYIPRNIIFRLQSLGVLGITAFTPPIVAPIEEGKEKAKACIEDLDRFIRILSDSKQNKTGEVDIVVTLLNAGDTDGLIRSSGKMAVSGIEESLSIVFRPNAESAPLIPGSLLGYPLYHNTHEIPTIGYISAGVKVEKRSMISVVFSIDNSTSTPAALDSFRKDVKNGNIIKFTIELQDFKDRRIIKYKEMSARYAR